MASPTQAQRLIHVAATQLELVVAASIKSFLQPRDSGMMTLGERLMTKQGCRNWQTSSLQDLLLASTPGVLLQPCRVTACCIGNVRLTLSKPGRHVSLSMPFSARTSSQPAQFLLASSSIVTHTTMHDIPSHCMILSDGCSS